MAKKKRKIYTKKTVLIVGEGPQEEAFLKHIKGLFDRQNNQVIKVESADGGSPRSIIEYVVRKRHVQYDNRYILMDSDVSPKPSDFSYAKKNGIIIFFSKPRCLDGMLLKVLSKPIPSTSKKCKKALHNLLCGAPTSKSSYEELFSTKTLSESNCESLVAIIKILKKQ